MKRCAVFAIATLVAMVGCNKKDDDNKSGKSSGSAKVDKAKTTEAMLNVKKIYDGARAYYMDAPVARGSITPGKPQFPAPSMGPTPPLGACCKGAEKKCAPAAAQWNKPVWTALKFSVDAPHYYSYSYQVSADGKTFTARANGDLDCDGEYSTFEMTGKLDPRYGDGPMGTGGVVKTKPLE